MHNSFKAEMRLARDCKCVSQGRCVSLMSISQANAAVAQAPATPVTIKMLMTTRKSLFRLTIYWHLGFDEWYALRSALTLYALSAKTACNRPASPPAGMLAKASEIVKRNHWARPGL